ncbi:Starch-binding associating with outer membrane [Hydrobacter penzbergensis]|uniref:Starch-binding associating with outer membrane n=1 Tax=Hydrobacter penzbergensis TaxID=1235997 RepID=A0A8X8ID37_9BACT|nr:RagB/SusD family nutrient uptake outer membrane protein [Hydrobacter penzbergensis]SDX04582.1 Starch-binding associating with outer membrane [Hydrobacter penzbergensis]
MYTMNNIIIKKWFVFSFLIILVSGMQSCTKQLEKTPVDQVDGQSVFSSVQTLEQGVLGVYADWQEEYIMQLGSVPTDECRIGLKNAGVNSSAQSLFRWTFSLGDKEIASPWATAYQIIGRANSILGHIGTVPVKNVSEETKRNQLKGELLAIRAFQHFDLYRAYAYAPVYTPDAAAVPYITRTDLDSKPSRPATADFFKLLKQDISDAETLLAQQTSSTNIRMGLNALQSLEARVALYAGDWQGAIDKSSLLINKIPLATPNVFPAIWQDQSDAEVIFKLKRTNRSAFRPGDVWKNVATGIVYFAPALKLMRLYDSANDVRYSSYFATDSSLIAGGQLPNTINKYAGQPGALNLADVKVFRTAEMYLIRAEAYARMGRLADGTNDLNTLRAARIQGYTSQSFASNTDLIRAILTERYKELAFEGHRLFDLRRTNSNIERLADDLPAGITKNLLQPSESVYHTPIPQAELLVNSNILPNNPGW